MQTVTKWIQANLNLSPDTQAKLLSSLAIVLVVWLLRLLILHFVNRRTDDVVARYRWRQRTGYVAVILSLLLVGPIWLRGVQPIATYLGLLSAGIAIALKDPLTSLAGWVFIVWRRPFSVGDRIQIGDHAGDVVDLSIFQFGVMEMGNWVAADQTTGRILYIPNQRIFQEVLANYTTEFEYIWNEIPVLVTYESDWKKAKAILQEIANRHAAHLGESAAQRIRRATRRFMIRHTNPTPAVFTRVEGSGILLTIRYVCEPHERRLTEQAIWEDVLDAFAEHADIELAYPTQRFYQRWLED
jgi:small-conductance mechanosensitive channel